MLLNDEFYKICQSAYYLEKNHRNFVKANNYWRDKICKNSIHDQNSRPLSKRVIVP